MIWHLLAITSSGFRQLINAKIARFAISSILATASMACSHHSFAQLYPCQPGDLRSIGCDASRRSADKNAEAVRALTEELRLEEAAREKRQQSDRAQLKREREDQKFRQQLDDLSSSYNAALDRQLEVFSISYQNYQTAISYEKSGNYGEAIRILESIQGQFPEAGVALGLMYQRGHGVSQNWSEAIRLYMSAASDVNPNGYYYAAIAYRQAPENIRDIAKSDELYSLASKLGVPGAQYWVARQLFLSDRNRTRMSELIALLKLAQVNGYAQPSVLLADIYKDGIGVSKNILEAERLYLLAIDDGSAAAMVNLGNMYSNESYNLLNYSKALELYKRAARKGSTSAFLNLSEAYELGYGVPVDKFKALFYGYVALQKGDVRSRDPIERISATLDEAQKKRAIAGATGCLLNSIESCL
jgi:TPR repeat protein